MYEQEADRVAEQVMRMSASNHIGLTVTNEEEEAPEEVEEEEDEEEDSNISRKSLTIFKSETNDQIANEV